LICDLKAASACGFAASTLTAPTATREMGVVNSFRRRLRTRPASAGRSDR
jgi:hypothetical protein